MKIKITDKNGITLHTTGTYCKEDIELEIDPSILEDGGIDTSDATASENDILLDKTAYVNGKKITGTIETKSQEDLVVENYNVIVKAGYYPEQVSKSVAIVEQAELFLEIDYNTGLIESSSNQEEGYVVGDKKVVTKQLPIKEATTIIPTENNQKVVEKGVYTTGEIIVAPIPSTYVKPTATKEATTYTPTTSNQTIASGTYLNGNQTIKGDTNLKAENIKSGVSIFGVTGSYEGSGGGSGGGSEDTITDLTNTIWKFNETIIFTANTTYNVNFTSADNTSGATIDCKGIRTFTGVGRMNYILSNGDTASVYMGSWNGDYVEKTKIIKISGGTDATNTDFITWLMTNATQLDAYTLTYTTATMWDYVFTVAYINGLGEPVAEYIKCNGETYTFFVKKNTLFYSSDGMYVDSSNSNLVLFDSNGNSLAIHVVHDLDLE